MGPRFKILTPASDNGSVLDQLAAGNEQTVLSYYLNEPDAFTKLPVSPDDFGLPVNRMIFGAILDVYDNSEPLNNLSVSKRLREKGELEKVGADSAIVSILNSPSSFPTAEYALELMRDASAKREALKIVGRFQKGDETRAQNIARDCAAKARLRNAAARSHDQNHLRCSRLFGARLPRVVPKRFLICRAIPSRASYWQNANSRFDSGG